MNADLIAELDLLGVPLFALRAKPGGPIKGRYEAPKGWNAASADRNDRVLTGLRPNEGVGVVGGTAVDILDADPRNGGAESLARLAAEGLIPQPLAVVETPSGGWHVYVPSLGVGKSTPLPGLDLQGAGSFVLAPPTPGYRALAPNEWPELGQHHADAADRLRHAIDARFRSPDAEAASRDDGTPPTPQQLDKARAVLEKACREVRTGEGGRNNSVSRHLLPLYNFVLAGCLDQAEVEDRLWEAAQDAPGDHEYTRAEFVASCESAMTKARPERPHVDGPQADFDLVPPDPSPEAEGILARFPKVSLAELLDPNQPPREYVVDPMILAGVSVAFVAPAGHRKSLIALGLAVAVASGAPDFAGMPIPKARHVLYVDMENTTDDLRERLLSFGLTASDDLGNLILLSLPALSPLDTERGGKELLQVLDAYGLQPGDLVVLDSYQRVTEAGENDSDTTRGYYRHTGVHLKARGLTVIRTDNTGKDVARGARGSSGKRDDVDVEYLMESKGGGYVEVSTGKVRQRGVAQLAIRVEESDDGRTTFSSDHTPPARRRLDDCIAWLAELGLAANISQREAERQLKELYPDQQPYSRALVREACRVRREMYVDDDFGEPSPDRESPAEGAPSGAARPHFGEAGEGAPDEDGAVRRGEGEKP